MLNLTRKKEETIVIGGGIVVKVLDIRGGKVSLGVQAPPDVPIWRGEEAIDGLPPSKAKKNTAA